MPHRFPIKNENKPSSGFRLQALRSKPSLAKRSTFSEPHLIALFCLEILLSFIIQKKSFGKKKHPFGQFSPMFVLIE